MSWISNYILRLIGACMVAGVARKLLSCTAQKKLGNTVIGLFLIFCAASPLMQIEWRQLDFQQLPVGHDFEVLSQQAQEDQRQKIRQRIKTDTQEYVWNKAQELSMDVEVDIQLGEQAPYTPIGIVIRGHTSPYAKHKMIEYLQSQLGIPKEAQHWISANS